MINEVITAKREADIPQSNSLEVGLVFQVDLRSRPAKYRV